MTRFEINYSPRGFHVYRSSWKPTIGENVKMEQQNRYEYDQFAISIGASLRDKITALGVEGHIPREISRYCRIFFKKEEL